MSRYPKNPAGAISVQEAEKIAKPASFDELEAWMKNTKAPIISEGLYEVRARAFLEWQAKQPSERARKAANKRWEKDRTGKGYLAFLENFKGYAPPETS